MAVISIKTDQVPPLGAGIEFKIRRNGIVVATFLYDRGDFDPQPDWDGFGNGALQLLREAEKNEPNAVFESNLALGYEIVV